MTVDPVRLCITAAAGGSRLALLAAALLMLAGLVVVVAAFVVLRRRAVAERRSRTRDRAGASGSTQAIYAGAASSGARRGTGAGLEVAGDDLLACPCCLRQYAGEMRYCPHDARALVAAAALGGRTRGDGGVCPACRRGFDPGVRFCAHDGVELAAVGSAEVVAAVEPTGVIARACPRCSRRFDLAASFCAEDGSELVIIH